MMINKPLQRLALVVALSASFTVQAAKTELLGVQNVFNQPSQVSSVSTYSISLASSQNPFTKADITPGLVGKNELIYSTRVKVNGVEYHRLMLGNFASKGAVNQRLSELKASYPGAWINARSDEEISALQQKLNGNKTAAPVVVAAPKIKPVVPAAAPTVKKPKPKPAKPRRKGTDPEEMLSKARDEFIDQNYTRVLAITDKVIEIGNQEQREQATELSGLVRERRGQLAQAVAIYNQFIEDYPESKITPRIEARLQGLNTMMEEPRAPLAKGTPSDDKSDWYLYGSFAQTYRNDSLELDSLPTQDLSDELTTDLFLFARKSGEDDTYEFRFDGGARNDFLTKEDDLRVGTAQINYSSKLHEFQIIGGRQSGTAEGVYQRFDGVVFKRQTRAMMDFSAYLGSPVASTYDGPDGDNTFVGGSLNLALDPTLDVDVFLLQQNASGMTDRQALGSEVQWRASQGFLYGLVDYDLHFGDLNNLTTIGNYRFDDKLTLNFTVDHRSTPLLSMQNALQGLGLIDTLDELKATHNLSDDQIQQLAEDRTRRLTNLLLGASYQLSAREHLMITFGSTSISASEASTTPVPVSAIPSTSSIYISTDYSHSGLLFDKDFTVASVRLSDTDTARVISLRGRSRIPSGDNKLFYDPRIRIDKRDKVATNTSQLVLAPSFRLSYRPTKKVTLEATVEMEVASEDMPDGSTNDETLMSFLLGYIWTF